MTTNSCMRPSQKGRTAEKQISFGNTVNNRNEMTDIKV